MIDLSAYSIERLSDDGEFMIRRAIPPGNGQPLLLTSVMAEVPAADSLDRMRAAYALRGRFSGETCVAVLDLIEHEGRLTLVQEDPGGMPLESLIDGPMELTRFLRIAVRFAAALGDFHGRGFIHRDIRPAYVFADAEEDGVRIGGFGLSLQAPRQRQTPEPPEVIAGTLAYMAPEQTGRMNRSVDSRSDLYAFGVSLYQMLTGRLPFTATEPMELVHCHLARQPVPPVACAAGVPRVVSDLVMKLMAKAPEDRYQTAAGVEADLQRCLDRWLETKAVEDFVLGRQDFSDRLWIREKLYGREREIEALRDALDRVVSRHQPELVLVSGYSGMGKSSVVLELHHTLVSHRGRFAAGKFDQYQRGIPYATLAQALQGLVNDILAGNEPTASAMREALLALLDGEGSVLTTLVPALERLIGTQPEVQELPAQESKARFQRVIQKFLQAFATQDRPLVLFFDDLQWLDAATLDLLGLLMGGEEVKDLLLIGAYRDNEVDTTHPLARWLVEIRQKGQPVSEIVLQPLSLGDVNRLVAEALHLEVTKTGGLAALAHGKTGGNPFFVIQFFLSLVDDGLLSFDAGRRCWVWREEDILAQGFTDNVLELMAGKLHRLSAQTQETLGLLACLGVVADVGLAAALHPLQEEGLQQALEEAVRVGLVIRTKQGCHFAHDRVQEAAYLLRSASERTKTHRQIARLLAARPDAQERVFEIASHFGRSQWRDDDRAEKLNFARLHLLAAQRAKAAMAYAAALSFAQTGCDLLPEGAWKSDYVMSFDLHVSRAECEFLTGAMAAAEQHLAWLAERAASLADLARVTCHWVALCTTRGDQARAVEVALAYLRRAGLDWQAHPPREDAEREYAKLWALQGDGPIEALVHLPRMTDPAHGGTLDVLTLMQPPALFTDEHLHNLVVARMAGLSLEHGNSDGSGYAYTVLGVMLGHAFGDYESGYRFGQLGCELVERTGLDRFKARVNMSFGAHVRPWSRPLRDSFSYIRRAADMARASGDLNFTAFSAESLVTLLMAAGTPLDEVLREADAGLALARKLEFGLVIDILVAQRQCLRSLHGLTNRPGCFNDETFDETRFEQHFTTNRTLAFAECWYWIRKLQTRTLCDHAMDAVAAAAHAEELLWTSPGHFELAEYHFHAALAHAARHDEVAADAQAHHRNELGRHVRQLESWARSCPDTFENRAALAGAELARLEERHEEAQQLYEKAAQSARKHGFIQNEAMAFEWAARFYVGRGLHSLADCLIAKAHAGYQQWRAHGKVRQLEEKFPQLRRSAETHAPAGSIHAAVEQMDLKSLLRLSQAVSREIELESLIHTFMTAAVQHAGAERGLLLLPGENGLRVEAEATTGPDLVSVKVWPRPVAMCLPDLILNYVSRLHEKVVLQDAALPHEFSSDPYFQHRHPRSVLCLPLLKQRQLIGVLYLENNLASHVFTPSRLEVLKLLASQAAISLENARLYSDLQQQYQKRLESEQHLRRYQHYLAEAQRLGSTGSFGWDVDTGAVTWSEETYRLLQQDPSMAPDYGLVVSMVHPDDRENFLQTFERAIREKSNVDFEHRFVLPDGQVRHMQVYARLIVDEQTGVREMVGATMDITARKKAEVELHRMHLELTHVSRVATLGEMAASIAHEVNQPLAGIVTNASSTLRWLDREPANLEEARASVQRIIRDGNRAADVVGRLRSLFKKTGSSKEPLLIHDTVHEVIAFSRSEINKNSVLLRLRLDAGLPAVTGDKVQLQQVLLNLILNSVEAMSGSRQAARELTIHTLRHDEECLEVRVQDTGPGFDPQHREKIFDAFYTTKPSGMGMGLSISRSIIEDHGGKLWVEEHTGPGVTFVFTLKCGGLA